MRSVGIVARRPEAAEHGVAEDSVVEGDFFDAADDEEIEGSTAARRPWRKVQFGLAALSATPLLFFGGLTGWPWDSDGTSSQAQLPPAQQNYPLSVSLERLDIVASTEALSLDSDTKVLQPPALGRAGWYEAGPEPGELGRAVILARRSLEGADTFGRLVDARVSDRIVVRTAVGQELTFVVRSVEQFLVEDFPVNRVYGGPAEEAQLRLVTSAGDYDPETGFPRNVVVFADLLD